MAMSCIRVLLLAVTVFTLFHAVSSFMCHTKTLGKDDDSVVFCGTLTCFSVGASVGDSKDSQKGCAEEHHETECVSSGIAGIVSGHMCYCNSPLCNSAYTPTVILPLLLLPALLQYFL